MKLALDQRTPAAPPWRGEACRGGAAPSFLFPRGNECLGPGEELTVRWRYEGPARSARLGLLVDGQPHPAAPDAVLAMEPGVPEHSATWTVPIGIEALAANLCLVVENDQGLPLGSALCPPIRIVDRFQIEILSPGQGAVLRPGQRVPIALQARGSRPSLIQVWLRAPAGPRALLGTLPGDGAQLLWTVPERLAPGARLEVVARDADGFEAHYLGAELACAEAGPLEARLTSPEGGLPLRPGTELPIGWAVRRGRPPYALQLLVRAEGGLLHEQVLDGAAGTIGWTVPDIRTDRCEIEVRATDAAGAEASALSEPLRVLGQPLQVRVLGLGDAPLRVGQQVFPEWEIRGGLPPYQSAVYLRDNGDALPIAAWQEDSVVCWTVCNRRTTGARIQVLVRDQTGREVRALSDEPIVIQGFSVRVAYPNGREHVKARQRVPISWESEGPVASFSVNLIIDGEVADAIARDLPGDARSVDWSVPFLPTRNAYIQVIAFDELGRPMADDLSDGSFCISSERPLVVTVVHPNGSTLGDQAFHPGERVPLRWRTEGCSQPTSFKVELVILEEGERRIFPIAGHVGGDVRTCEWVVPDVAATDTARIRVYARDEAGYEDNDDSDYYFRIVPRAGGEGA